MISTQIIFTSILAFTLTWFFLKVFIPHAYAKLISYPNQRSSHIKPTPQGGGIVFILIGSIFSLLANLNIVLYAIPTGIIGLLDDLFKIKPSIRYLNQIITVFFLIKIYKLPNEFFLFDNSIFIFFIEFIILIFLTGIINFINFMDGIDGLVALNLSIFLLVASIDITASFAPLLTALVGFLIWNWSPAKIFMGDSGSTFLGVIVAAIILQKESISEFFCFLLILTPLIFDAMFCVIRRFFAKQNIFRAHKLHLYQRLYQAGWKHSKVTLIYGLGSFILALLYLNKNYIILICVSLLEIFFGIYLDKFKAKPFNYSKKTNKIE